MPTSTPQPRPVNQSLCKYIFILHIIIIIGEAKPHRLGVRNNTRIMESHVPTHTVIT